jgi:hypothetical protein
MATFPSTIPGMNASSKGAMPGFFAGLPTSSRSRH